MSNKSKNTNTQTNTDYDRNDRLVSKFMGYHEYRGFLFMNVETASGRPGCVFTMANPASESSAEPVAPTTFYLLVGMGPADEPLGIIKVFDEDGIMIKNGNKKDITTMDAFIEEIAPLRPYAIKQFKKTVRMLDLAKVPGAEASEDDAPAVVKQSSSGGKKKRRSTTRVVESEEESEEADHVSDSAPAAKEPRRGHKAAVGTADAPCGVAKAPRLPVFGKNSFNVFTEKPTDDGGKATKSKVPVTEQNKIKQYWEDAGVVACFPVINGVIVRGSADEEGDEEIVIGVKYAAKASGKKKNKATALNDADFYFGVGFVSELQASDPTDRHSTIRWYKKSQFNSSKDPASSCLGEFFRKIEVALPSKGMKTATAANNLVAYCKSLFLVTENEDEDAKCKPLAGDFYRLSSLLPWFVTKPEVSTGVSGQHHSAAAGEPAPKKQKVAPKEAADASDSSDSEEEDNESGDD
jgi:hypothetical protein